MANKAGLCRCGHEIRYWHDPATGQCMAGRDWKGHTANPFGTCPCVRKVKATKMSSSTKATTRAVTIEGEKILDALDNIITGFQVIRAAVANAKSSGPLTSGIGSYLQVAPTSEKQTAPQTTRARDDVATPSRRAEVPKSAAPSRGDGPLDLVAGAFKILEVVSWWSGQADDEVIAIATGYRETSRRTYVSMLVGAGLVERRGKRLHTTPAGEDVLIKEAGGDPMQRRRKPQPSELFRDRLGDLGEGAQTVLNAIAVMGTCSQDALLEATGYKETSVRTYVSDLVSRHLVVRPDRGMVRLHRELGGPS